MAFDVVPKPGSVNSSQPSKVISRQEVKLNAPSTSTARVDALKKRLSAPPSDPIARRPAGSSARAEEMAKLKKFNSPAPAPKAPATSARTPQDLSQIEPPPSGLVPGAELAQPDNTAQTPKPTTEASPSEQLSPEFVALARKERQIRKAQQDLKTAQEAWKQEQAKYISKDSLSSDTLKALSEAGITADKLVELQLNQAQSQDPNQVLLDRISQLEKQITGITDPENGTLAQRDKQEYDGVVAQIGRDAKLLVDSDPAFELTRSEGKTSEVVNLITKVFETDGELLDVEEAANLVEKKLTERLQRQFDKISRYTKIKGKTGIPSETTEEATMQQRPAQKSTPRINTLTNVGASQPPLSPRDRAILKVQEAINAKRK